MVVIEDLDDYIRNPKSLKEYPEVKLPQYVYHGTLYDLLDQIATNGLGAKGLGDYDGVHQEVGFFFSTDSDESYEYATRGGEVPSDEVVVLQIPTRYLDRGQIYLDYNNDEAVDFIEGESNNPGPAFFYKGILKNIQKIAKILD